MDSEDSGITQALVPVREQAVTFYGDEITGVEVSGGEIYVPLKPISDNLGLAWSGQFERLKRDPVIAEDVRLIRVTRMKSTRGNPDAVCLPLRLLPGWLARIQAARVKEELREKIILYQRYCYEVLWNAFKGDIMPTPAPSSLSGAALALEIAEAIAGLARQQLDMEQRLGNVAGRQTVMAEYLKGYIHRTDERLTNLELQLSGGATISEAQAAEIAMAVKNVGQRLAAGGDKQGYAKVYSEMYRRYRISGYKNLPGARYQEVLDWLHGWHSGLEQ